MENSGQQLQEVPLVAVVSQGMAKAPPKTELHEKNGVYLMMMPAMRIVPKARCSFALTTVQGEATAILISVERFVRG